MLAQTMLTRKGGQDVLQNETVMTQTGTRCLAVNAAFLREIKDDNRFLDELLLATRDALMQLDPSRLNVRSSVELLRRLRDRVAMHFAMEEAFGYIEGSVTFPPQLSLQADLLKQQHESLYLDLCEVVDRAEQALYQETTYPKPRQFENLAEAFDNFYRRLLHHDVAEEDLIADVFRHLATEKRNKGRTSNR